MEWHDGLARVYLRQNRSLETVDLYRAGLDANPTQAPFYDRLARALLRLGLGHGRQEADYKQRGGLVLDESEVLTAATRLYLAALSLTPKKYLQIGLRQVTRRIEARNTHTAAGRAVPYVMPTDLAQQVQQALQGLADDPTPARLSELTDATLQARIVALDAGAPAKAGAQPAREQARHRRRNAVRLHLEAGRRAFASADYALAEAHGLTIRDLAPMEAQAMALLKRTYRASGQYDRLLPLLRSHHLQTRSYWSALGLAKALRNAVEAQAAGNAEVNEALDLYQSLLNLPEGQTPFGMATCLDGVARAYIAAGATADARTTYIQALDTLPAMPRGALCTLALGVAQALDRSGEPQTALRLLSIALRDPESLTGVEADSLRTAVGRESDARPSHDIVLLHDAGARLRAQGQTALARNAYDRILALKPSDVVAQRLRDAL